MPTRRTILAAFPALPVLAAAALAHEGHAAVLLDAKVISAGAGPDGLLVQLLLGNRGDSAAELSAIYSDFGELAADRLPLVLAPGAARNLDLLIEARDLPGIFTLILDFGEGGFGPVTVIPT